MMPDMDPPINSLDAQIAAHGHPIPAHSFTNSFEDGFVGWETLERVRNDSIQLVSFPTRAGKQAALFTVHPGDLIQHGNRAEITHNFDDPPGG